MIGLGLFASDVPLHCINEAAAEYHLPAKLIVSVLNVEQGRVGMATQNRNGSYDLGPMQINTSWWPTLSSYGITQQDVRYNPCVNVKVGTWILAHAIAQGDDLLQGIGDYNSHTPKFNTRYTQWVRQKYSRISILLADNQTVNRTGNK